MKASGAAVLAQPGRFESLAARWPRLSLVQQFALVSSAVVLICMATLGMWVARKIEAGVTSNAATSAALYIESVFTTPLQPLADRSALTAEAIAELDQLAAMAARQRGAIVTKVWFADGVVAYSSNHDLIGRHFTPDRSRRLAFAGEVIAEFDLLDDADTASERALGLPLVEIYVPVWDHDGRVIAVAEFYEDATELHEHLGQVRRESWLVTCAVTLLMIIALYWIVARGSRTIERQRTASARRVTELSTLLQQNEELRGRVQRSARQAAEHIERYLNRLGSDLHDGAAQMIAFALLRLDATTPAPPSPDPAGLKEDATTVREALLDALNDVRDVCNGLIIPEVRDLSPTGAFLHMARAHQRRTGTSVLCTIGDLPAEVPQFTQLCLCRFIQEALNNAFRHAEGRGQRLNAWFELEKIYVEVSDDGPGMPTFLAQTGAGLGLRGLTDRLACLGGALMVSSTPGRGTSLTAVLPVPRGDT